MKQIVLGFYGAPDAASAESRKFQCVIPQMPCLKTTIHILCHQAILIPLIMEAAFAGGIVVRAKRPANQGERT